MIYYVQALLWTYTERITFAGATDDNISPEGTHAMGQTQHAHSEGLQTIRIWLEKYNGALPPNNVALVTSHHCIPA